MHMWYLVYAKAHSRINSLYHFSIYQNICLSYKTSSLACNHFQIGGGGKLNKYKFAFDKIIFSYYNSLLVQVFHYFCITQTEPRDTIIR
jgi:hypothetical protein